MRKCEPDSVVKLILHGNIECEFEPTEQSAPVIACGLDHARFHQTRHIFGRTSPEDIGSIIVTIDAHDDANPSTPTIHAQRISVKRDLHGTVVVRRRKGTDSP